MALVYERKGGLNVGNYTAEQLTTLRNMYAKGVLRIREGETWIEFNSLSELRKAITDIENQINNPGGRPQGSYRITVNKGY